MGDKYTEAQKKASIKYLKERTDSIQIRTQKGTKERWKTAAEERGKSLNQFIVDTVETEISAKKRAGNKPRSFCYLSQSKNGRSK
jgi:predicted HicB family RNase H-like nuclease